MPSTTQDDTTFSDLPPFPSDVPTAPLLRLSLQKLLDNDSEEIQRLSKACREVGFFYLDLRNARGAVDLDAAKATNEHVNGHTNGHTDGLNGTAAPTVDGNDFLSYAERLFGVQPVFFDLPVEEKVKYDLKDQGSYFGYKGYGAGIVDKEGNKDRNEFYNVSKDDILGLSERVPAPQCLDQYRPLLHNYIQQSHAIVTLILAHLDSALHLPSQTLPNLHRLSGSSGDQVRFVKAPPQPPTDMRTALGAHTDFGSVTLLFNRLGGLQILPPESDGLPEEEKLGMWQYVKPLKGHCVVNLGDAMVKFTRGVLRSNIHRVVNPPGEQSTSTRFSLVYFNRPEDEVMLKPLEGSDVIDANKTGGDADEEVISSKEWVLRRALGRRGVGNWEKSEGTEAQRGK